MAGKKTGPSTLRGSKRARQITVAVLETLSGELSTTEAAAKLGVSLSRYYQLEARALTGILQAVEPRTKGPQKTPEREIQALQAEKKHLERELRRHQALLRAAHRSVGLAQGGSKPTSSKGRARKKRGSRGRTVLETLRRAPDADPGGVDGTTKRDGDAGGQDSGQSGRP
ncbi:MAG: hypothetical protein ACYTFD_16055 [Planctomycetota bacterium]|jgi:hypothetical protein